MGQCTVRGGERGAGDEAPHGVSLEKAKSLSSNAAITHARYHLVTQGSRKLEDDYVIDGKVLGQGLCGDVVLVRGRADGRRYALKTISKEQVSYSKLRQLTAEVEIYLALDHPNIARLHNVYETESEICLLTECCEGGELYFRLQQKGVYTDADAAGATRQMLRAVGYLHSHNVVHRDLKLENFLYQGSEDNSELQLIDFGFAKIWDPSTLMMASCGSIAYVSPDVLGGQGYTNKCDLWSLGIIVWMLLVGYPPFHGDERTMMTMIKDAKPDWSHKSRWKPVSADALDFVQTLLTADAIRRPDAQEALRHRWLTWTQGHSGDLIGSAALSHDVLRSLQRYAKGSKVRRAILQLLAQELTPEETQDLRQTFLAVDRTNVGTICLQDLKDAIRRGGDCSPERRLAPAACVAPEVPLQTKDAPCLTSGDINSGDNSRALEACTATFQTQGSIYIGQYAPSDSDEKENSHPRQMNRFETPSKVRGARAQDPLRPPFGSPAGRPGTSGGAECSFSPVTPARQLRRANSGILNELFVVLDANGDERINYSDFLAAAMETRSRQRAEAIRATFSRLDADSSGTISVDDFRDVIGETFEGAAIEELVAEADPSGTGEISFEVFVRILEGRETATPARQTPCRRPPGASPSASPPSSQKRVAFATEEAQPAPAFPPSEGFTGVFAAAPELPFL